MTDSPGPVVPASMAPPDGGELEGERPVVLPGRAALYGLAGFAVGAVAGVGLALAGRALGLPSIVVLLLNLVGLWVGLLGACRRASRRYGTGHLLADFGLRIGGADVGWGILMSLAARFAGATVLIPFLLTSRRTVGDNTGVYGKATSSPVGYAVFAVMAVCCAPVVEELFFRGLLLRSLSTSAGTGPAIVIQALLFGLAHFSPLLGLVNLSVIAVIGAAGIVFGLTARGWRLGTSVVAHATFNLISVIAAAFLLFG